MSSHRGASFGVNMKWTVARARREELRRFFVEGLGAEVSKSLPDAEAFALDGAFHIGIEFVDTSGALSDGDQEKAPWLEFAVADVAGAVRTMDRLGVPRVAYDDPSHAYFRAPGGPVFRLAAR